MCISSPRDRAAVLVAGAIAELAPHPAAGHPRSEPLGLVFPAPGVPRRVERRAAELGGEPRGGVVNPW